VTTLAVAPEHAAYYAGELDAARAKAVASIADGPAAAERAIGRAFATAVARLSSAADALRDEAGGLASILLTPPGNGDGGRWHAAVVGADGIRCGATGATALDAILAAGKRAQAAQAAEALAIEVRRGR